MCLEGLAKFEKDRVLTEIPPEKNEKEKSPKCKYWKKGEIPGEYFETPPFDPDEFLENLDQF